MNHTNEHLIHLAYGNPPSLCGAPDHHANTLYVPTLWHDIPPTLRCPWCHIIYTDNQLPGPN
jgi:hypothetical protein